MGSQVLQGRGVRKAGTLRLAERHCVPLCSLPTYNMRTLLASLGRLLRIKATK